MNQEVTAPLQTEVQLFLLEGAHEKARGGSLCFYPPGDCGGECLLWCWGGHTSPQSGLPVQYILLFVCLPKSFFLFLFKKSSLIQYITPSSSPSIPPALLPSLPQIHSSSFPFRKEQPSQGYQPNKAYQVTTSLRTSPLSKAVLKNRQLRTHSHC